MRDYKLTEKFAVIGLDGIDAVYSSAAKQAVMKGVKAAALLEDMLNEHGEAAGSILNEDFLRDLKKIKVCSKKELLLQEKKIVARLSADGSMAEVQDLMACDLNYESAGMRMRQYRSNQELYIRLSEEIRAEILEEGALTSECVYMLWLFRETGLMHELFSAKEQEKVNIRLTEEVSRNAFYQVLFAQDFHSKLAILWVRFLKSKGNVFANPYLEGVNLLFPFLDRRKAIFIDMVVFNTTVKNRRESTAAYLRERGHLVEEVKNGEEHLLKIDNSLYRIFPTTRVYKFPVQGISLVPYYR